MKVGDLMPERLFDLATLSPFPKKLIVVLEQDEEIGMRFVQLIQQETPFQGILATRLSEARNVLAHLKCDVLLLTDETFPEDDLARLYLPSEDVELPTRLNVAFLSSTYNYRDDGDMKSIIKAVALLLAVRDSPGCVRSPEHCFSRPACATLAHDNLDNPRADSRHGIGKNSVAHGYYGGSRASYGVSFPTE